MASEEYRQIMDILREIQADVAILSSRMPGQDKLESRVGKLEKSEHRRLGWVAGVGAAIGFALAVIGYLFKQPG